ncbi:long-chain-fatty-acid--CoA ligase ACSBG1 isoform X1 [Carassius gibelio]|uniref:long-chain-fatty-acid--CoA ligase ACSBG1 isoform X1 n=2 Tax=Carassius gibelio TaxID=101364 RepID=UPI002278C856|nr:long-chain-fatty-acid--CoA ligase ACSBG1 isoform X1 [Carassius gibelio]XP_052400252.1 long-chain-fatty-acid--CoA ligase ACSBG1 isoform X1 [Carassius gibelio]XP_052400253.1 long-chain-fatty-acid--CoA ligase ACSBG1 isoform X1 [Carassius gibelio]XP_052400254.1 long-chain-fatty-acid--CoA ligase ACSBG1 isoform X1 [Carassius gibelio]
MSTGTQIHQQTDPTDNQLGQSLACSPVTDLMQQDVGDGLSEKKSIEEVLAGAELAPAQSLWTTEASGSVQLRMDELCPEQPITVHQMFTNSVQKYGKLTALASKKGNKWEKVTFLEYYHLSRMAAKGFLKLGLERFHSVAILGFNSAEWFIAAVGTVFAGGIVAGIYTTNSPDACFYVANDSRANVIVVENQKQLDKILEIKNELPHLKAIVQYSGSLKEKLPNLYSWEEFMGLGLEVSDQELDEVICSQKANQCCVLIYTSGTTGSPKGVMLSHDNITWTAHHASRAGDMQPAEISQESLVSYLPLSHIAAQIYDLWTGIQWGEQVTFAQPDALKGSLVDTLREATPTAHMGVPRVWEKIMEKIKEGISRCGYMKRKLVTWAMSVSLEANQRLTKDEKSFLFTLADSLVLQKLRAELGFSNCVKFFSGAAPIGSETLQFFLGLNIRLYEAYGMSESSGPHFMSGPKAYQFSSCGKVVPGCQYKLVNVDGDGIGEVCFWGRNVFMGFLNLEDKTKEALDEDGWLRSGDLGRVDEDGFLYITGRIKELIITAGGENIPPLPIEDAVKQELAIISNAMLIGDKRKFLSILLTLKCTTNPETTEPTDILSLEAVEFCQRLGSQSTKVSDILGGKDKLVYQSIEEGIARVNSKATSNAQRIQKWTILGKDFSIVGGELGPTMKLRRPVVLQIYHGEIESFYKD